MKRTQRGWNSTIRPSQTPIRRNRKAKAGRKGIIRNLPPEIRWRWWRDTQRELVKNDRPLCEVPNCGRLGEQWHHPFGRVGEPWVSSQLVTVHLCFQHHEVIHHPSPTQGQRMVRDQLRVVAVHRMRTWLTLTIPLVAEYVPARHELRAYFRYLVGVAKAHELNPPGFLEVQRAG